MLAWLIPLNETNKAVTAGSKAAVMLCLSKWAIEFEGYRDLVGGTRNWRHENRFLHSYAVAATLSISQSSVLTHRSLRSKKQISMQMWQRYRKLRGGRVVDACIGRLSMQWTRAYVNRTQQERLFIFGVYDLYCLFHTWIYVKIYTEQEAITRPNAWIPSCAHFKIEPWANCWQRFLHLTKKKNWKRKDSLVHFRWRYGTRGIEVEKVFAG